MGLNRPSPLPRPSPDTLQHVRCARPVVSSPSPEASEASSDHCSERDSEHQREQIYRCRPTTRVAAGAITSERHWTIAFRHRSGAPGRPCPRARFLQRLLPAQVRGGHTREKTSAALLARGAGRIPTIERSVRVGVAVSRPSIAGARLLWVTLQYQPAATRTVIPPSGACPGIPQRI